jgi:hypothetical protein
MTNKELFYFAGKCLTLDEHPEFRNTILSCIANGSINWHSFIELCSNHLILPAIYLKFLTHEILSHLPEDLSVFFAEIYDLNQTRNTLILKQLQQIANTLNVHNIHPTFLKGAGNLLDNLYSKAGERIMGDIDFLVHENEYLLAVNLLKDNGYSVVSPISSFGNVEIMKHYPRLIHPDFPAAIEIHRIPVRSSYLSWFNTSIIDQEKKIIPSINGCFVESDNHKIVHNFIHSQLSNQGHLSGVISLRDLYDIYLLSKRSMIKNAIIQIRTKQKAIAYFLFAGKVLGIEDRFCFNRNFSYLILSKKHSLNQSSTFFYHTYRNILFFKDRIFTKYIGQLIGSIFSVRIRKSLYARLSDRKWYNSHFQLYRRFFSPNK